VIFLAFAVLLLPGLAWWAWLGKRDQDPLISLTHIVSISLSLIAIMAEGAFLLGVGFSTASIITLVVLFASLAAAGLVKNKINLPAMYHPHLWVGFALFALTIALRLYQARELLLPNWVDSQHHYLIVRVILENKGLPENLSPHLATPFYYHYGFHAVTALFTAVSRLEIGQAMLILGQVLNAVISLSVYTLAKTIWKKWQPATIAALLVSFVTRMPAYYLSWGRYTLTAGMLLLPVAIALCNSLQEKTKKSFAIPTLTILVAGVLLTHYLAGLVLGIFILIFSLFTLLSRPQKFGKAFADLWPIITASLAGLLLALPWLMRLFQFSISRKEINLVLPVTTQALFKTADRWVYVWKLLGPLSNTMLLGLAVLGLIIALVRRRNLTFAIWSFALILLTLPWAARLTPFREDHFAIILFLPITIWAGWLVWQSGCWLGKRLDRVWPAAAVSAVLVAMFIVWAYPLSSDIVNPVTVMVTQEDIEALDWVKENTPPNARFYINTAYWLNNTYRGVDGGGWLLPYTGRWAIVPTVFYGYASDTDQVNQIRSYGERANAISTCTEDFYKLLEEANLSWVYLKQDVGALQPQSLEGCPGIQEAYKNSKVTIYQITP